MENSGGAYDVDSEGTSSSPGSSYVFSSEVVEIPSFTGMENIAYAPSLCLATVWSGAEGARPPERVPRQIS